MSKITQLLAREILDSRGYPTVEVFIALDTGEMVTASAPGGTSTGKHEAIEIRDGDMARMGGRGVKKAVAAINDVIRPMLIGQDPTRQTGADQILFNLDGTPNKSKLGANAILPVSTAVCKAGAACVRMPMYRYLKEKYGLTQNLKVPTPIFNLINGGAHGAGNLDFQEFHVIPTTNKPFNAALQLGVEMFMALEQVLISKNAIHSVGVEGGFAPNLFTNLDALELLMEAMKRTPYAFGQDLFFGLDVAANSIFKNGKYVIRDRQQPFSAKELTDYYKDLNQKYHIFSLEDPFAEDDWGAWKELTAELSDHVVIVGDDLLTTNKERLEKAVKEKSCTAILVKPNQIGTISETVEVVKIAKDANFQVIVSHRSGETNDDFIADFAVGMGAQYTKFGAPIRGERVAKYNRLLQIESELTPIVSPTTPLPAPTQ
ncbi:phosphopyruvate hydratase [Candidatus Cerribacteria bacterium 'Amazon FNV 2010 28 9']|uniref:Enolase n=1 Tax=Candidatus Cerribacteria bacterium 'Amazon FNV 2010 28 9' TaxID=2081795 RepID=A0A317JQK5_9BACT|nr:MAG: phosphopyruvate hydratase [Candidatus Cerribacteria bacterium 'Amazon FNV 2010 28 9']